MADLNPVQKLTLKLGAICEGEEPSTVLAALTTIFACLTAPVEEETFRKSVEFFNDKVGSVRADLLKADKEETKQ